MIRLGVTLLLALGADYVAATAGVGPSNAVRVPDLEVDRAEAMGSRLAGVASSTRWELGAA